MPFVSSSTSHLSVSSQCLFRIPNLSGMSLTDISGALTSPICPASVPRTRRPRVVAGRRQFECAYASPRANARARRPQGRNGRADPSRPVTLVEVHGESHYGAHRLPFSKTAAGRIKRGRPADQAVKVFQDRQLQLSKVLAPFCEDGRILGSGALWRQPISRYLFCIFRYPLFFYIR
jgi:hypothetical protein